MELLEELGEILEYKFEFGGKVTLEIMEVRYATFIY